MVSWAWLPEDKGRGSGVQCAGWQAAAALQFERSKNAEGLQGHHEENPGGGQAQLQEPQFPLGLGQGGALDPHLHGHSAITLQSLFLDSFLQAPVAGTDLFQLLEVTWGGRVKGL